MDNPDLWEGVIMDRASYNEPDGAAYESRIDLIKLRDISEGHWNVDTVYILTTEENAEALEALARKWDADEVDFIGADRAARLLGGGGKNKVLRVWWD